MSVPKEVKDLKLSEFLLVESRKAIRHSSSLRVTIPKVFCKILGWTDEDRIFLGLDLENKTVVIWKE